MYTGANQNKGEDVEGGITPGKVLKRDPVQWTAGGFGVWQKLAELAGWSDCADRNRYLGRLNRQQAEWLKMKRPQFFWLCCDTFRSGVPITDDIQIYLSLNKTVMIPWSLSLFTA